jgi:glucose 1-dehydrogenase
MRLGGKIAIVTGGDSGIGQATAVAFAEEGADVAVTFLHDAEGAERTRRLAEASGRRVLAVRSDQRDPAAVARLFERVAAELGAPDVLVNAAGVGQAGEPVADMPVERWEEVIRSDLSGPFFCCREFVRLRRARGGGGKIVNVTSVHESIPSPEAAAYGAAKGGLRNLSRALALEAAPDRITVNNVAPGLTDTPMTAGALGDPEARAGAMKAIPLGRPAEPREVARMIVYLASADADYVTGQTFTIDGGLTMNWGQGA